MNEWMTSALKTINFEPWHVASVALLSVATAAKPIVSASILTPFKCKFSIDKRPGERFTDSSDKFYQIILAYGADGMVYWRAFYFFK